MSEEDIAYRLKTEPPYREGFLAGMKMAYDQHLKIGDPLPFLTWVLEIHGPEVWNELYSANHSSHGVSLGGLTRADGRRVTRGW